MLFSPFVLGSLRLKNRILVAAMGNNFPHPQGSVSDRAIAYYIVHARGNYRPGPGSRANREVLKSLQRKVPQLLPVGDCLQPRRAKEAMHEGFLAAMRI